jgi:hypothetical protein
MKSLKTTKLALLSLAVGGLALTALVQAQEGVPEEALREIGIMRNIFDAALDANAQNRNGQRNRFRMGPPEALYLAGQGMVFTFHLNGSGAYVGPGFELKLSEMANALQATQAAQTAQAEAAQAAAQVFVDGDYDFDFDFDFDFDDGFGNSAASEQQQAYRQQLRDMNELIRDKQEELRDAQRDIRELQREERSDPDVDNDDKIDALEESMETLVQELQNQAASMQQLQQEYRIEQLAVFEAVRAQQTEVIFSTLCDYGTTLRSLANGEHVSIVLRNYADNQTQIHVFDYPDISNCSSAETLRQTATSYMQDNRGF